MPTAEVKAASSGSRSAPTAICTSTSALRPTTASSATTSKARPARSRSATTRSSSTALPVAGNHNGGRIAFGPDGMLYAGVGDATQRDRAQDLDDLGGKILRLTPEGGIPDDNPFPDSPVWSYGHRNVQGLAWAADGTMFATEFGQNTWDELNIIEPGGDYGWPIVEGQGGGADFIDPVQQWTPDAASPSGMAIIGDTIFIANLRGEVLRAVPTADPVAAHRLLPARVRAAARCGPGTRRRPVVRDEQHRRPRLSRAGRRPHPPRGARILTAGPRANDAHAPTDRGSPHLSGRATHALAPRLLRNAVTGSQYRHWVPPPRT